MGYQDMDLTRIRLDEARKMGLERQRVYRAMSADRLVSRENKQAFLRQKILAVKCFFLQYGEIFYCRTLDFFYSRSS
jgi:hypothetical protein